MLDPIGFHGPHMARNTLPARAFRLRNKAARRLTPSFFGTRLPLTILPPWKGSSLPRAGR